MQRNITKKEIVLDIANKTGTTQAKTAEIVQKTFDFLFNAIVEGKTVELRNFGIFEVRLHKKRKGRNPNKPENEVIIPAMYVPKFRAGKALKLAMKQHQIKKKIIEK